MWLEILTFDIALLERGPVVMRMCRLARKLVMRKYDRFVCGDLLLQDSLHAALQICEICV